MTNFWLTSNILQRIENPNLDFQCFINKTEFETVPFDVAADNVAKYLANLNKKIFVAFSGGYDSDFVIRRLHSLNIPFTPIIVRLENFSSEREYAYKTLRELKIKAIVLKLSTSDYVSIYLKRIHKELNATNASPVPYYLLDYVHSENGILVVGEHLNGMRTTTLGVDGLNLTRYVASEEKIRDVKECDSLTITDGGLTHNIVKDQKFYMRDYNMFHIAKHPDTYYMFFMQTPQIVVSMLDAIESTDLNWSDYKERVFKLRWRPKLGTQYREFFTGPLSNELLSLKDTFDKIKRYNSNPIYYFGTKEELRKQLV